MGQNTGKNSDMFENWLSLSGQIFGDMTKMWTKNPAQGFEPESFQKTMESFNNTWNLSLQTWQSVAQSLQNPDESFLSEKSLEERRQALEKIMETMADSFKIIQEKGMEQAEAMKSSWGNFDPEKIDKEMFKKWETFYTNELSKVLGMPQVGLGREYQEKMADALDKFNLFNATLIEFLYFLYLPMEKTFILMQKDIEKMAAEGKFPENSEELYSMWLKKLESHYMSMFHSNEYVSVMAKTLENMAQFKSARDAVLEDVVSTMPVPTKSEIDEMYKEVAELKRTVKRLEKEKNNN
eukprot:gnl/Chilomastix_cuspidata/9233.p1 GENE.gnl/Chilomastix_cuspidata/9233~~gnl/Chilomastix_cuspidata/9233.p1  ORF type:complete len:295 (-),score=28.18 gnl/Chilomastix_cuspidata/9233:8-892(-)